jgi:hypothetical protein
MRRIRIISGLAFLTIFYCVQIAAAQCNQNKCSDKKSFTIQDIFKSIENMKKPDNAGEIKDITDSEKKVLKKKLDDIQKNAYEKWMSDKDKEKPNVSEMTIWNWNGKSKNVPVNKSTEDTAFQQFIKNTTEGGSSKSVLSDDQYSFVMASSVPVSFQDSLADAFTPYYRVSSYETDQFATFQNNPYHQIKALYGQNPLSYFRVHPMGFKNDNYGTQYGFFKLDYLTLWNNDSGLVISDQCIYNFQQLAYYYSNYYQYFSWLGPIFTTFNGLGGHTYDDERSAVLVGAPSTAPYVYNQNPNDYYIFSAYAAAHEWTQSDRSTYTYPNPVEQGHVELYLALSKHGTYFGNPGYPNNVPLAPQWVMDTAYTSLQQLYLSQIISYDFFISMWSVLDNVFYTCIAENFEYGRGIQPAYPRINVGEPVPGEILNECGFIVNESHVLPKLQSSIWPTYEQPPAPVVSVTNYSRPGSNTFYVGDQELIVISNGPRDSDIYWSDPRMGSGSWYFGRTNASGYYSQINNIGPQDLGQWNVTFTVGGIVATPNPVSIYVYPAPVACTLSVYPTNVPRNANFTFTLGTNGSFDQAYWQGTGISGNDFPSGMTYNGATETYTNTYGPLYGVQRYLVLYSPSENCVTNTVTVDLQ